ncbi:MAG TPA: LysR family transcriptional regulator [Chloroflexota bacterium]|nr:LysR family transcriptional regulator [Chloroflexota bacterium]
MLSQRIRVFHAVATNLSYSKAAHELGISQPAVSFHIRGLEEDLGVSLFERVGKQIFPTTAGRILAEDTNRMVILEEEALLALSELQDLDRGVLVIGASATIGIYLIPDVLGKFRQAHPGVKVNLKLGNKARTLERLRENEVDFGLVAGPLEESELVAEPYLEDELIPIVGPGHRFAQGQPVRTADLKRETLLVRERGSGTQRLFEERLFQLGVQAADTMQLGSTEAIKQAAAANLGLSVASRYAVGLEMAAGRLVQPNLPSLTINRNLLLVHHKDKRLSRAAIAFRHLLHQVADSQRQSLAPARGAAP